jgi:hypothetical protein
VEERGEEMGTGLSAAPLQLKKERSASARAKIGGPSAGWLGLISLFLPTITTDIHINMGMS